MREQLRLGALHWLGHCTANTGGLSQRLSTGWAVNALKKIKNPLSTQYLNAECLQTHFCWCDVNSVKTPSDLSTVSTPPK